MWPTNRGEEREAEARRQMERVVELAPGFMPGYHQLLRILRAAGDAEAAPVHSFVRLDVGRLEAYVAEAKEAFTAAFFAERAGQGRVTRRPRRCLCWACTGRGPR